MASRSFMQFVEQEIGKLPHFLLYAVLEWIMIIFLFLDGFLSFIANGYAKFFDLKAPCLLCSRIDHILPHKNSKSHHNESLCELHKRYISSLAYCHVHRKLSDIKTMCEGCLLSFATERESDTGEVSHKDVEDNLKTRMEDLLQFEIDGVPRCTCCGEVLKAKPSSSTAYNRSYSSNRRLLQEVHATSPRGAPEARNMELPHIRFAELKFVSDIEAELAEDDDGYRGKEENKSASLPPLPESDDATEEVKTPTFARGNRFFGIPLTDSPLTSPKWASRLPKKLLDKSDLLSESNDTSEAEGGDSILLRLKRQVRLDRKSLIALYMELDEERSASAVAANNAMAMITRLQAEKAAVQMEALQYQRLMEEQAEYDQEALQMMKEEVKAMEAELEAYREKYGPMERDECDEVDDFQDLNSPPHSSGSEKSGGNESSLDFESERSFLLGMLTNLEKKLNISKEDYEVIYSEPNSDLIECKTEDTGTENKAKLMGEVSDMRERLRAMEADSGFLQHAAMTLDKGSEGTKLLKEIALHLRKLRRSLKVPSEDAEL